MNLLVFTLLVTVVQNVVTIVGEDAIVAALWSVYTRLSTNATLHQLAALKRDQLHTYKQQQAISAQDQYAKWTKLNRKLDALKKDIEALSSDIAAQRAAFQGTTKSVLYVVLKLPILAVSFWYRSAPIYYLPEKALPGYVSWFLRFPTAPANSIGITTWCFSINTVFDAATSLVKHALAQPQDPALQPGVDPLADDKKDN